MQSGRGKGLEFKLLVVQSLVFIIPFLIFLYFFNKNRFVFNGPQMIIVALILLLILAGLIMLRQIFDRFLNLASSMKTALGEEKQTAGTRTDTDELHEITDVFDTLMHRFENTTDELGSRVYELIIIRELIEAAAKSREIDELLNLLLEKVMAATHSLTGSVFVVERETERFRIVATSGFFLRIPAKAFIWISRNRLQIMSCITASRFWLKTSKPIPGPGGPTTQNTALLPFS